MKYRRQRLQRKNTEKYPRYSANNENYRENRPENRLRGLYEPKNTIFRPFLRFSRPPDMKFRKNESVEQSVAGYDPQVVAMQWPSLAAFAILTAVGRA